MTAVLIPSNLIPIARTNADWAMDIAFAGEPDWVGSQVSVIFARQGLPGHAFEATIGDGLLEPTADLAVALRIPQATWEEAPPASYSVQVRRLKAGAIDDAAAFVVDLQKGLSGLLDGPGSAPILSGAGELVGNVVVNRVGSVQVVRGAGTQDPAGPAWPPGLIVAPTEPELPTGEQALWLQSGLGPDGDQYGLFLVTGD
ncbi:hypothetical protein [Caulobacter sp.]|uniref:hypothetical protein n=1 Tax=Caulobacter sp. TaxID=78 RepID=UPI003BAECA72